MRPVTWARTTPGIDTAIVNAMGQQSLLTCLMVQFLSRLRSIAMNDYATANASPGKLKVASPAWSQTGASICKADLVRIALSISSP
jgi:hypothetical protein